MVTNNELFLFIVTSYEPEDSSGEDTEDEEDDGVYQGIPEV